MELRKHYILDEFVIISESRGKRPHEFKAAPAEVSDGKCFFCPGNEDATPGEIMRVDDGKGGWKIRVFPNKFEAVKMEGEYKIRTDNKYFTFSSGYGKHEIIVETPNHEEQLWDLDAERLKEVFDVYSERTKEVSKMEGIKFVAVFKNSGKDAGTSIVHSHTQVIAENIVPQRIYEELKRIKSIEGCPYCEIIDIEKGSYRRCFENDHFVAFTPYASQFRFEIWVFPKEHLNSLTRCDDEQKMDLARIMHQVFAKLKELNAPYNFFIHYSEDEEYHFHIEVTPRLATWAGFEESTGIIINAVSPETAAKFYRGEE